jgi:dTDP-4-dehydrorhamnose reductase
MEKEKVLITGCGGMLGFAAYKILSNKYDVTATDIDINETWLSHLDVTNISEWHDAFRVPYKKIFHLAALTDLEFCETHPMRAYLTNSMGVENAVRIAEEYDAELIYISTAGIFDDPTQESFTDYDIPSPKSVYGKSKYSGELIAQRYPKHYIFRAGWMMGGYKKDKKFVGKIMSQIDEGVKELFVVDDKLGTPTYTHDFIANMIPLLDNKQYGLYNQVCRGECSRYDVAVEMVNALGLGIKVTRVDSSYFNDEYFAPRPHSEKLINLKLQHLGLNNMRYWQQALRGYLASYR